MRASALLSRTLACCAVAGALSLAAPAQATQLINTGWLTPPSGEVYTIHWAGHTPAVASPQTGGFVGTFGGTPIVYWCFDLEHTFSLNSTLDYVANQLTGPLADALSQLLNIANANGGFAGDRDHSAAFQLAIWDLEYDSDHNVATGNFHVTGGATAINIANGWLALVGGANYVNPTNTVTALNSTSRPQHQNFITFNNVPSECCQYVPEPPILPLVLTALGAVALIESRRRMRVRGG